MYPKITPYTWTPFWEKGDSRWRSTNWEREDGTRELWRRDWANYSCLDYRLVIAKCIFHIFTGWWLCTYKNILLNNDCACIWCTIVFNHSLRSVFLLGCLAQVLFFANRFFLCIACFCFRMYNFQFSWTRHAHEFEQSHYSFHWICRPSLLSRVTQTNSKRFSTS